MKTILFVCTGNICRSPMAEGIFRHAVKGRGDYEVYSAGVGAIDGLPPSEHAVRAVRELGIDISRQRSRMLTAELVRRAVAEYLQHHAPAVADVRQQAFGLWADRRLGAVEVSTDAVDSTRSVTI